MVRVHRHTHTNTQRCATTSQLTVDSCADEHVSGFKYAGTPTTKNRSSALVCRIFMNWNEEHNQRRHNKSDITHLITSELWSHKSCTAITQYCKCYLFMFFTYPLIKSERSHSWYCTKPLLSKLNDDTTRTVKVVTSLRYKLQGLPPS